MNTNTQHIKRYARYIPHISLIVFALITSYFCISYYRLSKIKPSDLNELTSSVESVWLKKAKGKQGKPEVWISMGQSGKYRVVHANNSLLQELSNEIKANDVITIYLKKAQLAFLDLGNDNDILQIARNGQVIYSLDIPQKDFLNSTLFSAIMSLFLPLAFLIYWSKSKNNLIETLKAAGNQKLNVSH